MIYFLQLLILFSGHTSLIRIPPNITIKGIVIDSTSNRPIVLATLTLTDNLTGVTVGSSFTKSDSTFELTVPANRSIDLGRIPLSGGSSGQLQEVSIAAARPVMKQEIDRLTYDVQADPESKSNDALEMLRKVPMVTVDGNNMIQLKGSSSFQIYFNGKPSALMANNPADVLKAMDASTIQRIEVITVPPARYDAEGLAGIINIITVKNNTDGFTGSVFTRYNNIMGERGSVSLRAKQGRFGFNTFFGIGHSPLQTTAAGSQLTIFSPYTIQSQQGQNVSGGKFNNGQAEVTYEPDSLQLITGIIGLFQREHLPAGQNQRLFLFYHQCHQGFPQKEGHSIDHPVQPLFKIQYLFQLYPDPRFLELLPDAEAGL
jgi:hypothetical protein